jgi:hypothetical protein
MTIIDTVGTLELSDTGRRCTTVPEDGEIVRVYCPKCGDTQVLGKNLATVFWISMKANAGWHLGCADPEVRARHAASLASTKTPPPSDACPICDRLDCGGAAT